MQIIRFTNGGFVVHKLQLAGVASRFSVWVSPQGILEAAARYDACNREYPVPRESRYWARLDSLAQILAEQVFRHMPVPAA